MHITFGWSVPLTLIPLIFVYFALRRLTLLMAVQSAVQMLMNQFTGEGVKPDGK